MIVDVHIMDPTSSVGPKGRLIDGDYSLLSRGVEEGGDSYFSCR
jgi:hypothetical protein